MYSASSPYDLQSHSSPSWQQAERVAVLQPAAGASWQQAERVAVLQPAVVLQPAHAVLQPAFAVLHPGPRRHPQPPPPPSSRANPMRPRVSLKPMQPRANDPYSPSVRSPPSIQRNHFRFRPRSASQKPKTAHVQLSPSPSWGRAASESSCESLNSRSHSDYQGPRFAILYWGVDKRTGLGWDLGTDSSKAKHFPTICKSCDGVKDTFKGRAENAQVTLRVCAAEGPGFKRYVKHFMMATPQASAEFHLRKWHVCNKARKRAVMSESTVLGGILNAFHRQARKKATGITIRNTVDCYKGLLKRRAKRYRRQAHNLGGKFIAITLDEGGNNVDPFQMVKHLTLPTGEQDTDYGDIKRVLIILGGPEGIKPKIHSEFTRTLKPYLDAEVVRLKLHGGTLHSYFALARLFGHHDDKLLLPWVRRIINGQISEAETARFSLRQSEEDQETTEADEDHDDDEELPSHRSRSRPEERLSNQDDEYGSSPEEYHESEDDDEEEEQARVDAIETARLALRLRAANLRATEAEEEFSELQHHKLNLEMRLAAAEERLPQTTTQGVQVQPEQRSQECQVQEEELECAGASVTVLQGKLESPQYENEDSEGKKQRREGTEEEEMDEDVEEKMDEDFLRVASTVVTNKVERIGGSTTNKLLKNKVERTSRTSQRTKGEVNGPWKAFDWARFTESVGVNCKSGKHRLVLSDRLADGFRCEDRVPLKCEECEVRLQDSRWVCIQCREHYCFECRPRAPWRCWQSKHDLHESDTLAGNQFCLSCDYRVCSQGSTVVQDKDKFSEDGEELADDLEPAERQHFTEIHLTCHRDACVLQQPHVTTADRCSVCGFAKEDDEPKFCSSCGSAWRHQNRVSSIGNQGHMEEEKVSEAEASALALYADRFSLRWTGGSAEAEKGADSAQTGLTQKRVPRVRALALGKRQHEETDCSKVTSCKRSKKNAEADVQHGSGRCKARS